MTNKMTKKEKQLLSVLIGAEKLIERLDPEEKNKKLMEVYRFIHSFNTEHSCFKFHSDWRAEFQKWISQTNIK